MKTVVLAAVIAATILPAKAQLFSREALGGAALGGIVGGIIGHNSGRHTAEGIGIGAGAGLLLGALSSSYRRDQYQGPYFQEQRAQPEYETSPAYRSRPNYAVAGTVVGGIAGGVIGHNSGRHTAEGVAIGAGTGLIFGGIAEHEQRKRERLAQGALQPPASAPSLAAATPSVAPGATETNQVQVVQAPGTPQQVSMNNDHSTRSSSQLSSANALFGR